MTRKNFIIQFRKSVGKSTIGGKDQINLIISQKNNKLMDL